MTPVFLAAQNAIVHPERSDGAYAVEGRLRRSHFIVGKLSEDLEVVACVASGMESLQEVRKNIRNEGGLEGR